MPWRKRTHGIALLLIGSSVLAVAASEAAFAVGLIAERYRLLVLLGALATVGGCLYALWRHYRRLHDYAGRAYQLLEQSPNCKLVLTEQGTILDATSRCEEVLGYSTEQLRTNHLRALVHPAERQVVSFLIAQATSQPGRQFRAEINVVHRNRRSFPAELVLSLAQIQRKRYLFVSIRDISERVRQERKVRRVLHTLDRIIRTMPQAVLIFDLPRQRFVYTGNAASLGWQPSVLMRWSIADFLERVHPDDRATITTTLEHALQLDEGGHLSCMWRMRSSNGHWRWFFARVALFKRAESGAVEQLLFVVDDLTVLMEERARSERLHERMTLATRGAGIGIWELDLHSLELVWDETMYLMHGIASHVVGKELVLTWWRSIDRHVVREIVRNIAELRRHESGQYMFEYAFTTPSGEERYIRAIATVERSTFDDAKRLIGIAIDETPLRQREQQQKKLERLLEESQRMARLGSWELDPRTMVWTVSREVWNLVGAPPQESPLTLDDIRRVIHPDDWERWREYLAQLLTVCNRQSLQYRIVRRDDGRVRWVRCVAEPVYRGGKLQVIRGTIQDITEQYLQEQELIKAREEALRAERAKSEFLANMSHEIRTPMNAILGFASLLDQAIEDPQLREYVAAIRSGGQALLSLINDILDLSKLEAGKLRLQPEPTLLRTFLEEVGTFLRQNAAAKGLELRIELEGSLPAAVELDTLRVRQILFNLLGNAIKFTEQGWIALRARGEPSGHGSWTLQLEVEDTGIGIPDDQLEAIFEAFQQVEGQSTRRYGGTGLGLAICKRLAALMGGTISVRSQLGKGSVFTVTLPNVREVAVEGIEVTEDAEPLTADFQGAVTVVVDDVESNRRLVRTYLERHGAVVYEAASADEAEELLDRITPVAMFLDIQMPGRSGIELARSLRQHPQWRSLRIVAVTASPITRDDHRALFDAVILKPVTLEIFLRVAMAVLPCSCSGVTTSDSTSDGEPLSPELVKRLEEIAADLWRRAHQRCTSADVEAFIAALEEVAADSSPWQLRRYIEQLRRAYESFDVVSLRQQLEDFPALLSRSATASQVQQ